MLELALVVLLVAIVAGIALWLLRPLLQLLGMLLVLLVLLVLGAAFVWYFGAIIWRFMYYLGPGQGLPIWVPWILLVAVLWFLLGIRWW